MGLALTDSIQQVRNPDLLIFPEHPFHHPYHLNESLRTPTSPRPRVKDTVLKKKLCELQKAALVGLPGSKVQE